MCRSAPRSSFRRTPIELQRCFATPAALCRQRGWRGLPGRVSPAGRLPAPASRTRQGLVAAGSPTTRVRLVRVPRLADGGDRAPSDQDHRGASLAGSSDRRASRPDRRPSRPVVSPTYAQGSYYGTNRVVVSAPGRFTGPAAPLLSTTRAARPSGRDRRRSRSSVVRTGSVSRKNRTRGTRGREEGGWSPAPGADAREARAWDDGTLRATGSPGRSTLAMPALHAWPSRRRLDEFVFRSNRRHDLAAAFGTLPGLGAMREPTTYDTITGARDIPRIICTL